MDHLESPIRFRPLALSDLPNIQRWLSDPDVAAWWREADLSLEAMIGKYAPIIDGSDPVTAFVIVIEGQDIGYIQAYVLRDHPAYLRQVDVDPDAVGIDLFIGEAEFRGRGWGSPIVREFLDRIVFGDMAAGLAMIAPEPANARAIRVYERVGFIWLKRCRSPMKTNQASPTMNT
jgi:aminoglycoside 6'-N-acetyltransferase